jgi:hypothetical protein
MRGLICCGTLKSMGGGGAYKGATLTVAAWKINSNGLVWALCMWENRK